jgi:hypothetical protein
MRDDIDPACHGLHHLSKGAPLIRPPSTVPFIPPVSSPGLIQAPSLLATRGGPAQAPGRPGTGRKAEDLVELEPQFHQEPPSEQSQPLDFPWCPFPQQASTCPPPERTGDTNPPMCVTQTHFRLLDLPFESVLAVASFLDDQGAFVAFHQSCRKIRNVLPLHYLQRHDLLIIHPRFAHMELQDTTQPLQVALFLALLPLLEVPVILEIGLDSLVAFYVQYGQFIQTQRIMELYIEWKNRGPSPGHLADTIIPTLYSLFRRPKETSLLTINLSTSPALIPLIPHPPGTAPTLAREEWSIPCIPSLLCLTISMGWTQLPGSYKLLATLGVAPNLHAVTITDASSSEECDKALTTLQTDVLESVRITTLDPTVSSTQPFLSRHVRVRSFDLRYAPRPTVSRTRTSTSTRIHTHMAPAATSSAPLRLPPIADVSITSHFQSIAADDVSAISKLTLMPTDPYAFPLSRRYCRGIKQFFQGARCISELTLSNIELVLQLPWRLSAHLAARLQDCQCLRSYSGPNFSIHGVKILCFRTCENRDEHRVILVSVLSPVSLEVLDN